MKYFFVSFLFLLVLHCSGTKADSFKLNISYFKGEKSKDSHSSNEIFSIEGQTVSYSIKYSGRRGKNQEDSQKECTFTEQDIANIKTTIISKGLNSNQTLTEENSKSKSFEVYCNIVLDLTLDGSDYKIRINGDTQEFNNNVFYNDTIFFIALLQKMVKDCS